MNLKPLFLSMASFIIAVTAAEIAARQYYTGIVMTGTIMTNDDQLVFRHLKGASVRLHTTEFENRFTIDTKLGVRVEHSGDIAPLNPRFAVYGDSMAFGYGVEYAQVFSTLLNQAFGEGTVLNAGAYSYGPDQEYILAKQLRSTVNPDKEVVLFYTGNDFENFEFYFKTIPRDDGIDFSPPNDPGGYLRRIVTSLPLYPLLCRLYLYHWTRAAFLQGGTTLPPAHQRFPRVAADDVTDAEHQKVERLAALFRDWSNTIGKENFYVILVPHQMSRKFHDERITLLQRLLQNDLHIYDYQDYMTEEEIRDFDRLFYRNDAHWTPFGHAVTAQVIARILQPASD